jgi:hypothetical protein
MDVVLFDRAKSGGSFDDLSVGVDQFSSAHSAHPCCLSSKMQLYRSGVASSSKALAARSCPRIVAPRTIARATATDVKPAKAAGKDC